MKKTLFGIATAVAIASGAITREEWEANPSLIPTPSASSAFYVVEPTGRAGEQTVATSMVGLDTTPTERTWTFLFDVDLITSPIGLLLIYK